LEPAWYCLAIEVAHWRKEILAQGEHWIRKVLVAELTEISGFGSLMGQTTKWFAMYNLQHMLPKETANMLQIFQIMFALNPNG
jgi:hypothetical protein